MTLKILRDKSACHRAGRVMVRPDLILADAFVRVEDGIIREIGRGRPIDSFIDHGPGVLMPGLVNAHVHLELTALKGCLDISSGFEPWVRDLLARRDELGEQALEKGGRQGISEMLSTGTLFAGEVSTLGLTLGAMEESGLGGVWFREMLGGLESFPAPLCLKNCPALENCPHLLSSFAGHAPHTTSPELLCFLKKRTGAARLPFSLHLAESPAEGEFIRTGRGSWASFLRERGIQITDWPLPARSPVEYLHGLGLLDGNTLGVHLLDCDGDDLEILARTGTCPVLCPRSNKILHGLLPDLPRMLDMGLLPALGTDSAASNDSLNLFEEMAALAGFFPNVHPREILAMATLNGATALGLETVCGTLEKGKSGAMLYLSLTADNDDHLFEKIITQ